MDDINLNAITIESVKLSTFKEKDLEVEMLRLDKIHPLVSGNKWFKLRYYLEEAKASGKKNILTYGGAWSNHIIATAAACNLNGLQSTGIIRGEQAAELSPILLQAKELGMKLIFTSREEYRLKKIPKELSGTDYYCIPEGGYGSKGAAGAATILDHCNKNSYTYICCAAGTGTMTAGLIKGALPGNKIIAASILKNNNDLESDIQQLADEKEKPFQLLPDYHFGGYAKQQPALIHFMNDLYRQTAIPSDFVYTGKLFFAVHDLARNNFFPARSKILLIHSGGLTGNLSLSKGTLIF